MPLRFLGFFLGLAFGLALVQKDLSSSPKRPVASIGPIHAQTYANGSYTGP
jgi:hypothetical protein